MIKSLPSQPTELQKENAKRAHNRKVIYILWQLGLPANSVQNLKLANEILNEIK